jgi:D-alanyl-D-alanine carboxypeptidase/D-alanyl-D-alanine-endopeptidase (penicillin-binding protein 4)
VLTNPKFASNQYFMKTLIYQILVCLCLFAACSPSRPMAKSAKKDMLDDPALQTAHVGICVYEPATGKYLYNYQGDKYFVPASNTKLPTCYAAMKYLGDSLVGLRYGFSEARDSNGMVLAIQPAGDPTFLHPDFKNQPAFSFLQRQKKRFANRMAFMDTVWKDNQWGSGWSWNDYDADYMPERSSMPVFGNLVNIKLNDLKDRNIDSGYVKAGTGLEMGHIDLFKSQSLYFDSLLNENCCSLSRENLLSEKPRLRIKRSLSDNKFWMEESRLAFGNTSIPFVTDGSRTALWLISDSLKEEFKFLFPRYEGNSGSFYTLFSANSTDRIEIRRWYTLHSQPTDSLLKPMMHRSDNFFAEQSLLMVSNELLGFMNDEKIIDTLLKTDFKDLPQKPRWVDGSGLSRYDLFTPQDLVAVLDKMRAGFGMERIKNILPTGNDGTLSHYYQADSGYIFAKTGTLSGVVALSGFLYTRKNRLFIFSVLVNNHQASATGVRRAVERFIEGIREHY